MTDTKKIGEYTQEASAEIAITKKSLDKIKFNAEIKLMKSDEKGNRNEIPASIISFNQRISQEKQEKMLAFEKTLQMRSSLVTVV